MLVSNSIPIKYNPIINETNEKRENYYSVLCSFTKKYSNDFDYSMKLIDLYRKALKISPDIQASNNLSGLFKYRYLLLIDILFVNAFDDEKKATQICKSFSSLFKAKYRKRINELAQTLYRDNSKRAFANEDDYIELWKTNVSFFKEQPFVIAFTANMSSGKSTLVNALVGKEVCKSQNLACTAKIHKIYSKPFDDGFISEDDGFLSLDASHYELMTDDPNNNYDYLNVFSYFDFCFENSLKFCFVDTPGVNSSVNELHKKISNEYLSSEQFDILIYVVNSECVGTDDEFAYMKSLASKFPDKLFIFVINKLDSFGVEDNIQKTVSGVINDIEKCGITNYYVCPVSAWSALVAKKTKYETEKDSADFDYLYAKLKRSEYDLLSFYDDNIRKKSEQYINNGKTADEKKRRTLLVNSGIFGLENILINLKEGIKK